MANTIYCGSGRKQNEKWLKITINPDKIMDYIQEYNGNKFIKLNVNIKDAPDQYGKDVSVSVDDWQPDQQSTDVANNARTAQVKESDSQDLPF